PPTPYPGLRRQRPRLLRLRRPTPQRRCPQRGADRGARDLGSAPERFSRNALTPPANIRRYYATIRAHAFSLDTVLYLFHTLARCGMSEGICSNEPKASVVQCQDPRISRRSRTGESKVDRAAKYQAYISSSINPTNPLPIGLAVELPNPLGGQPISFDECRQTDGAMIEAKGPGYLDMLLRPTKYPWTGAEDDMVWQARKQLMGAGGRTVEWYFAEDVVAEYMRNAFKREG